MKFIKSIAIVALVFLFSGCSVYMAAHQPTKKNVALFKVGTPRDVLIAEFGLPTSSEVRNGKTYEIFRFQQGYTEGAKAARALVEGTADVFTLGVTEVISTPVEAINDGSLTVYEVSYDSNNCVDQVILLTPKADTSTPNQSATPTQPAAPAQSTPPAITKPSAATVN
jgi:outer membrane protein assembly factor BamE (lipoprotein component of BamABCDE complex)